MSVVTVAKRAIPAAMMALNAALAAPAWADDWRALREVDLPAELIRATWGEESYLADGHPKVFGRMSVWMLPTETARKFVVKSSGTAGDGIIVDDLTCHNSVNGSRYCALLMNPPNRCYLIVRPASKVGSNQFFDVDCPADLTLGK